MKKYLITIQYDGKNYNGFQKQDGDVKTIESVIEDKMKEVMKEDITIFASGRTDAGVSAYAQTAHFESNTTIPCEKIPFALNEKLPDDIKITSCKEVNSEFHARFDVKKKTYVYKTYFSNHLLPLLERGSYWLKKQPNIKLMKQCAKKLEGRHNFKAFMSSGGQAKTFERIIYYIDIRQKDNEIEFEVCGNGFLYNMVRIIVGTLLEVGYKKKTTDDIMLALEKQDRTMAGYLVPAKGLYLKEVKY
ncbi:MAG: tRNA pseudouridine(38-40) synthase TruA [Clostridiales bacterium]|nr:tRNA pseudouridine(38-40) synthase TruA [Candidatus Apopatousia equi]